MSAMRMTLDQLRPELREQAKAKIKAMGANKRTVALANLNRELPKENPHLPGPKPGWDDPTRLLCMQLQRLPVPFEREVRFHPVRKWRFDFANRALMVAIEIEGITYHGRHQRVKGFREDIVKYLNAQVLGWTVIRVTGGLVRSGNAMKYIEQILKLK